MRIVRRRGDLIISETAARLRVRERRDRPLERRARAGPRSSPSTPTVRPSTCATRCARATAVEVGVIISDTFGRPWRRGLTDVAIGVSGIAAVVDLRDTPDALGRILQVTEVAIADEIASAAELVMGKASQRSRRHRPRARPLHGSAKARARADPAAGAKTCSGERHRQRRPASSKTADRSAPSWPSRSPRAARRDGGSRVPRARAASLAAVAVRVVDTEAPKRALARRHGRALAHATSLADGVDAARIDELVARRTRKIIDGTRSACSVASRGTASTAIPTRRRQRAE